MIAVEGLVWNLALMVSGLRLGLKVFNLGLVVSRVVAIHVWGLLGSVGFRQV